MGAVLVRIMMVIAVKEPKNVYIATSPLTTDFSDPSEPTDRKSAGKPHCAA